MTEPTDDDVLVKAKQLTHDDGRLYLWDLEDDQSHDARKRDNSVRVRYLNRALELLRQTEKDLLARPERLYSARGKSTARCAAPKKAPRARSSKRPARCAPSG